MFPNLGRSEVTIKIVGRGKRMTTPTDTPTTYLCCTLQSYVWDNSSHFLVILGHKNELARAYKMAQLVCEQLLASIAELCLLVSIASVEMKQQLQTNEGGMGESPFPGKSPLVTSTSSTYMIWQESSHPLPL